jgi:hypothetical protein
MPLGLGPFPMVACVISISRFLKATLEEHELVQGLLLFSCFLSEEG